MNSLERRTAKLNKESGSGQGKVRLRTMRRRVLVRILLTGSSVLLLAVLAFAMTAAWFTNVSRSSDLTFTVESWGFDEDRITVPDGPVSIAPGRSGVIPLRVNNSGSSSRVRLDVGVARGEDMPEKLRQRLYFCVDASRTVSGETVDRLYITDRENERQIYYLGPGAVLDIAEDYQTDQPIRWVFWEVYADADAYAAHRDAQHFKDYIAATEGIVTDKEFHVLAGDTLVSKGSLR